MHELIDAHAHLNEIEAIDAVLADARAAGVGQVVAMGMERTSNEKNLELAARYPGQVWPAVGYHPWSLTAERASATLAHIRENLPRCVALGEIGLDYKVKVPRKLQQELFGRLLEMAAEWDKPVVVHCRFSHPRAHAMVRAAGIRRAVFHWYSGPLEVLDALLADGYFISTTPALAYSPPHRAAALRAPLDRILVETDTPVSYQGRPSRPADLRQTVEQLSGLRQATFAQIARSTAENARRFYDLPQSVMGGGSTESPV
jgi:TatD DNase family protein